MSPTILLILKIVGAHLYLMVGAVVSGIFHAYWEDETREEYLAQSALPPRFDDGPGSIPVAGVLVSTIAWPLIVIVHGLYYIFAVLTARPSPGEFAKDLE